MKKKLKKVFQIILKSIKNLFLKTFKLIKALLKMIPKKSYKYIVIGIFVVMATAIGTTYGRYAFRNAYDNYLHSKGFYFESVMLDGTTYNLYDWNGVDDYQIPVYLDNYLDELRWTHENIPYEISVTTCNPSISGSVSCNGENGVIAYNAETPTRNRAVVTLSNPNNLVFEDGDYVELVIKAKSTAAYRKTLEAAFKINVKTRKVSYTITDRPNQTYFDFALINETKDDKRVTVSFDHTKVAVDNKNELVINAEKSIYTVTSNDVTHHYINGYTFIMPAKTSLFIRYYKEDISIDYTYPKENYVPIIDVNSTDVDAIP